MRGLDGELTDGVITLRAPVPGDAEILLAGRDQAFHRFMGGGDAAQADPLAIVVDNDRQIVGWIDYDVDRSWLAPGEANIGYFVLPASRRKGYAQRSLTLLLRFFAQSTEVTSATLLIDLENEPSIGVATGVGFTRHDDLDGELFFKFPIAIDDRDQLEAGSGTPIRSA